MSKTTLEMQTEYEQAMGFKAKQIANAIENVTITFNRIVEKSSPSQMVLITGMYKEALKEVIKIFDKYDK